MPSPSRLLPARLLPFAAMLALAFLGALPSAGQAQDTTYALDPRLVIGAKVRVTTRAPLQARIQGLIDSVSATAFVVDTATREGFLFIEPPPPLLPPFSQARVRYDDIERLELGRGRNRQRGMVRWGLIGAAVGALANSVYSSPERNPSGGQIARAAATGAVAGGLLGVAIGYFQGGERWESVALPEARPTSR